MPASTVVASGERRAPEAFDTARRVSRLVADMGWACLPQYTFNADTGEWKHRRHDAVQTKTRRWLGAVRYGSEGMTMLGAKKRESMAGAQLPPLGREYYELCLAEGSAILEKCVNTQEHHFAIQPRELTAVFYTAKFQLCTLHLVGPLLLTAVGWVGGWAGALSPHG
jgi:hypothetical protein